MTARFDDDFASPPSAQTERLRGAALMKDFEIYHGVYEQSSLEGTSSDAPRCVSSSAPELDVAAARVNVPVATDTSDVIETQSEADSHVFVLSAIPLLERHPIAEAFARHRKSEDGEDNAFSEDVRENGLRLPITTYQGKVLDGWRRNCVCLRYGLPVTFKEYTGNEPLIEYMSLNYHREHFTPSQVAAIIALHADLTVLAKHGGERGQAAGVPLDTVKSLAAGRVGERTLAKAIALRRTSPDVLLSVARGEVSLDEGKALETSELLPAKPKRDLHAECKAKIARLEHQIGITDPDDPAYKILTPENAIALRELVKSRDTSILSLNFIIYQQQRTLDRHAKAGHLLPSLEEEA